MCNNGTYLTNLVYDITFGGHGSLGGYVGETLGMFAVLGIHYLFTSYVNCFVPFICLTK